MQCKTNVYKKEFKVNNFQKNTSSKIPIMEYVSTQPFNEKNEQEITFENWLVCSFVICGGELNTFYKVIMLIWRENIKINIIYYIKVPESTYVYNIYMNLCK